MELTIKDAFKAARRPRNSTYIRPAYIALKTARENLARLADADAAKESAKAMTLDAQKVDSRRYAPGMVAARAAMDKAQHERRIAWNACYPTRDWRGAGETTLNKPFQFGDEETRHVTLGQWMESPGEVFRFVGLSSDIAPDRDGTTGYYVDSYQDETARGVVYQMRPTRDGFARFIPAIADPSNSAKDGSGPAIMLMGDIITATGRDEDSAEDARKDAARRAMECAETFADAQREYDTAYQAGVRAAEAKAEAAEARREFLELRREAKVAAGEGMARPVLCAALRRQAESLVDAWQEAKRRAARLAEGDDESFYFYPSRRLREAFNAGFADA